MGRLDKKKFTYTKQDEFFDYAKIALYLLLGYLYFHFVVMGWTI